LCSDNVWSLRNIPLIICLPTWSLKACWLRWTNGRRRGEAALRWTNGRFWGDVYSFPCGGELRACRDKRRCRPPHCRPKRKEEEEKGAHTAPLMASVMAVALALPLASGGSEERWETIFLLMRSWSWVYIYWPEVVEVDQREGRRRGGAEVDQWGVYLPYMGASCVCKSK